MMRKKIVSLCMALALCLSLLPATALAAEGAPNSLYVGDQQVINGNKTTFWTTDKSTGGLTEYKGNDDNWNVKYDPSTVTLTLKNATIKGVYNNVNTPGSGIYAASSSGPVSLNIVLEEENKVSGMYGIDVRSSGGDASLNISGSGSLTVSGLSGNGIGIFMSSQNNANLTIEEASVTALGSRDGGSGVRLITSQTGSPSLTIEVKGGSLQASGETNGIHFLSNVNDATAVANLKVSGNAMVKASNIITTKDGTGSAPELKPAASESGGTGGIIWDGKDGTVYGSVELQEDLEIGEGESLTLDDGASLNAGDYDVIVDGGTLGDGLEEALGDNVKYPPTITTASLLNGEVGRIYNQTLEATGSDTITWSVTSGSLPAGLSLSGSSISGTPTAVDTSTFTVTAENSYGSNSKELSITISAPASVSVTGVSLNKDSLNLYVGDNETLTATVEPANATNKGVTWSSDNESVATVNNGVVTAVTPGTAIITVTAQGDSTKSASCTVTVTAAAVPVTGVTLSQTQASLYYNRTPNTLTLTATVAPANATNQAVTWTSSNPSVATVENGVVTALACGTAVITATTQDGNHTATCTVTVRPDIPPANPNYRITVEATQGGTVTADPTAAKAGTTVTLTPVPHRGYQVGSVAVTDRFGEPVAVTEQADGTYTFTMPNGQVTVTVTFEQAPLPFPDVTEGDWFYDAVRYAYETGLMGGVGDSLFAPNSETTRAQLVTILYRLEGEPEPGGDSGFSDVAAGTWYTDAVVWAAENGIVNGTTDATFAPGEDITRGQLVTVLYRYAESKGYDVSASADLSGYPDAGQVQDYAQPAMAWAVAEGIVEGVDGNLNPTGDATRAQIATILMRFCEGVAK